MHIYIDSVHIYRNGSFSEPVDRQYFIIMLSKKFSDPKSEQLK